MNHALWLEGWLVTAVTETERTRTATATYIPLPSTCPKCGSVDRLYRHGVKAIDYRDTPSAGKQLVIRAEVKRFRCQDCLETCMQPLPDIDTRRRMTKRCVQHIASQGVPRTYADLARSIGVDEKTIRNICNERFSIMLAERTFETPVVLGIDEMTLAGRKRTVFVDVANKRFIDLIDAMNRGKVERWLLRLPDRERRVKCVTIDMWGPYKAAVRQLLPNATIVVDKWHVVSKAGIALDKVRNRSRRASKTPKKNPWAGKRLLQTSRHNLSPMRRMMVDAMLANNPLLDAAWNAKEVFYDIWTAKTRAEAERMFDRWAASIPDSVELEFRPVAKMVENWRHEIFAFFDYPITNAYTEAMNGLVKIINRSGRGYSFEAIRAKALLMNHEGPLKQCRLCFGHYPTSVFKRVNLRPPFPQFTKDDWYDACGSCHYWFNTVEWKPISEYSGSIKL